MWSWFSPAVPIIQALLWITTTTLHLITAFSDPGIIPRLLEDESEAVDDNPWKKGRVLSPQTRNIDIKGVSVQTKWCRTCQIHRPPRAIHCGVCDNCVDRFDHHCPWTGNCVGRRNYRYFLCFVTLVPIFCIYTIGTLVAKMAVLATNSPNVGWTAFWEAVTIDPCAPLLSLYALIPLGFVGFLFLYHMLLSAKDETTNERLKGAYRNGNPYSKGLIRNCLGRWCGYTLPRYVKFHYSQMEDLENPPLPDSWRPLGGNVEMYSMALDSDAGDNLLGKELLQFGTPLRNE